MKIINDFLEQEYFDELQQHVLSPMWPWYYQNNISMKGSVSNYGFNHRLINPDDDGYNVGSFNRFVYEVSQEVGLNNVVRCRLDMTTNRGESMLQEPHVDFTYPHTTTIFYVNDSDGNTVIYDQMHGDDETELTIKQEIEPKANRLIIFDGLHLHTGHTPGMHDQRVLINSNFV